MIRNNNRNTVANMNVHRPLPFYFINTLEPSALSEESIFKAMEQIKDDGFGGVVVFNKPPDGFSKEEYLEEKWFGLIEHFAKAGQTLELQIWINDGFNYPPGDAGGRIQKTAPHLKQRMFVKNSSGKIEVQEVDWGFPAFEEPESSELFIKLVYEKYKERVGKYFGNGINGFFSDADCRRFGPVAGKALKEMNQYFPCSINFSKLFKARYGYEIETCISDIIDGKGGQKAKDYWSLAGDLYAQWFKNNYEWCKKNSLKYTFHSSDTGPFALKDCKRSSLFTEGSYFDLMKYTDYPGTDHELAALNGGKHFSGIYFIPYAVWGGDASNTIDKSFYDTFGDVRAKYASSAAFLYDKAGALCEAFAATNWGADFHLLSQIAAWQIMQGINFFVPHAVHHKLHGETKFFAPPDFSRYGHLHHGMKEFNNWLTEMCMYASEGTLITPVALLDPSKYIWSMETDGKEFFEACDKLNYMPFGYVIADEENILKKCNEFKVIINPGLCLSKKTLETFKELNVKVLEADKIDTLPEILGNDISFDGSGRLQYMRRSLGCNKETLLVANIGNKGNVSGILKFKERETPLELYPGEIAVLGNENEVFKIPQRNKNILVLPEEFSVVWHAENIIPLSRLENSKGQCRTFFSDDKNLFFRWENKTETGHISILIPAEFYDAGIQFMLDGKLLSNGAKTEVFADRYYKFKLKNASAIGHHAIEIAKKTESISLPEYNNIYLTGDFSVNVKSSNDCACINRRYYSMKLYLPASAEVLLRQRDTMLKTISWAEQGHPFYSGAVTYNFETELPEKFRGGTLVLPELKSICSVKFNGIEAGKTIKPPHEFILPNSIGKISIQITVWNTNANMLDEYSESSGILKRPYIREKGEL